MCLMSSFESQNIYVFIYKFITLTCADPERGGGAGGPDPTPLKNHQNQLLSNSGPDPLKNHEATKPEFNVGPSSARQRNAI